MQYDFDNVPERRHTNSVKWDVYPEDVLPLWVADTDFAVCPEIIAQIRKRLDHPILGYPKEDPELIETFCKRMNDRYQWNVSQESILMVPGIVSGFNFAVRAFCKTGNTVLFQTPVYPPFFNAPENFALESIQNSLVFNENKNRYEIDYENFERQIKKNTKLFILCNPHNPVGRDFDIEELQKLAEICERHDLIICADEIHNEILYDGIKHTPIASISPEISSRTITFMAPSKTFNIPGLFCSMVITENPMIKDKFSRATKDLIPEVSPLSQAGALAAYRDGDEWLKEATKYLQGNRDFLLRFLAEEMPASHANQIEATFLSWIDFSKYKLPGTPYHFFLEKAKVALNPGIDFGKEYEQFVRLNFGTSRKILTEALERMAEAIRKR